MPGPRLPADLGAEGAVPARPAREAAPGAELRPTSRREGRARQSAPDAGRRSAVGACSVWLEWRRRNALCLARAAASGRALFGQ